MHPRQLMSNPLHFLSFGFGSGLLPKAPGTWGTLATIPMAWWLANQFSFYMFVAIAVMASLFGIWLCSYTAKALGVHDHPSIVWDEVCGYLLIFTLVPATAINLLLGFILFRWLDIRKPSVIGWCDRKLHGGLGIMADDLLAGLVAGGLLWSLQVVLDSLS